MYPEINKSHPAFNLSPAQKHRLLPQKPKIVWYSPDETRRIKYHDLIWVKAKSHITGDDFVSTASSAYINWDYDKTCFTPFVNGPFITYLGFAICPPGTKEGEIYVE